MGRLRIRKNIRCQFCKKLFYPNNTGRQFCSKGCYGRQRKNKPRLQRYAFSRANKLSKTDSAWLAGIFDGEGSIVKMNKNRPTSTIRFTISNTYLPLLERVQQIVGCGTIITQRLNGKRYGRKIWQYSSCYHFQCYSASARDLLKQILPWLIVKRDRAIEVIKREATVQYR